MTASRDILTVLGRFGDVISALPLAAAMAHRGEKPIVCVAVEFESILDGVSYVDKLVYPGLYNDPPTALRWLKANRPRDRIILAQSYRHPSDKRHLTDSYQTESWRVAGHLDDFGKWPLVFDRRDPAREERLCAALNPDGKPMILVATDSVSSPFPYGPRLMEKLIEGFPAHHVLNLSHVRAERIYDLIGLFDRAACLVSVDSFSLHLARAAKCPVVAIKNNGWFGSVNPPATIDSYRYENILSETLVGRLADALRPQHRFVVHCCDTSGPASPRQDRAMQTWEAAYADESIIDCRQSDWPRTAKDAGDSRNLPLLADVLGEAIKSVNHNDDVIVFSNSDNGFTPGAFTKFREHAALFGAFSVRRDAGHVGRDVFGFTKAWLAEHMSQMDGYYCGAPAFDLVLAAMIRKQRGLVTTRENLGMDFYPCELEPGLVTHEDHESSWAGANEFKHPANLINLSLARKWQAANGMEFV